MIEKEFTANTEAINAYGYRVMTEGIDLERFAKNPVCLLNHYQLVGKWQEWKKQGAALQVKGLKLSRNPKGQEVAMDLEDGILNAVSIGIILKEKSEDPAMMLPGQKYATVTKCELVEVSVVDVPANAEAVGLQLYQESTSGTLEKMSLETLTLNKMENPTPVAPATAEETPKLSLEERFAALEAQLNAEKTARESLQLKLKDFEGKKPAAVPPPAEQKQSPEPPQNLSWDAMEKENPSELLSMVKDRPEEAEALAKKRLAEVFAL